MPVKDPPGYQYSLLLYLCLPDILLQGCLHSEWYRVKKRYPAPDFLSFRAEDPVRINRIFLSSINLWTTSSICGIFCTSSIITWTGFAAFTVLIRVSGNAEKVLKMSGSGKSIYRVSFFIRLLTKVDLPVPLGPNRKKKSGEYLYVDLFPSYLQI
jgi:hypothetical protein